MHKWYYMKIEKNKKLPCENVKINRMIVIFTELFIESPSGHVLTHLGWMCTSRIDTPRLNVHVLIMHIDLPCIFISESLFSSYNLMDSTSSVCEDIVQGSPGDKTADYCHVTREVARTQTSGHCIYVYFFSFNEDTRNPRCNNISFHFLYYY